MGMALAVKRGQMKSTAIPSRAKDRVLRLARTMTEAQLVDYAASKAARLPRYAGGRRARAD